MFIEAVLYRYRAGVRKKLFKALAVDANNEYAMIDATIIRAHQHRAGALRAGGLTPALCAILSDDKTLGLIPGR